jgi:hypothetical protein
MPATPEYEALAAIAENTVAFDPKAILSPDTHRQRVARFIAAAILAGGTQPEVLEAVVERFECSESTALTRYREVVQRARLANDDEGSMEVVARNLVQKAAQRHDMFHAEAVAPVPEEPLTATTLATIARHRVEFDKAARANATFILDVFGRTTSRWSPKTTVDVNPLAGGTDEQRAAVSRLMGTEAPQLTTTEGTTP